MPDLNETNASEALKASGDDAASVVPAGANLTQDAVPGLTEPESTDGRELTVEGILYQVEKNATIDFLPLGDDNRGIRVLIKRDGKEAHVDLTPEEIADVDAITCDRVLGVAIMRAAELLDADISAQPAAPASTPEA